MSKAQWIYKIIHFLRALEEHVMFSVCFLRALENTCCRLENDSTTHLEKQKNIYYVNSSYAFVEALKTKPLRVLENACKSYYVFSEVD